MYGRPLPVSPTCPSPLISSHQTSQCGSGLEYCYGNAIRPACRKRRLMVNSASPYPLYPFILFSSLYPLGGALYSIVLDTTLNCIHTE
jgi:hypothetical protein